MSMRNKRVFWNTKCLYTEHGQRMGAFWDGEWIHYVDVDRMCTGSIECPNVNSDYDLEQKVDAAYTLGIGKRYILLDCADRDELEAETKEKAPSLKKD